MTKPNDNWTFDPSKYEGHTPPEQYTGHFPASEADANLRDDAPQILAECIRRGEEIERLRKEVQRLRQEAEDRKPKPINYEPHDGWRAGATDCHIQFADTTKSDTRGDGRGDD